MSNTGTSLKRLRPLILLLFALPILVWLAECPSAAGPPVSAVGNANQRVETYDAWLNAPWTDNDAPYGDLRRTIDIALVSPSDPAAIVQRYEKQFRKSPTDPKALFAYGYASFKAAEVPKGISRAESQANLDDLYLPIAASRVRPPHTYNFTRLGFLALADLNNPIRIGIGQRLLRHAPNDDEVEYCLANALNFSKVPADRNLAMNYQQDLAQRFPDSPRPYRLLGLIYYRTAWLNHSQTDADKSIAAYRRVLELSPDNKTARPEMEMTIKFIQDLQAKWK